MTALLIVGVIQFAVSFASGCFEAVFDKLPTSFFEFLPQSKRTLQPCPLLLCTSGSRGAPADFDIPCILLEEATMSSALETLIKPLSLFLALNIVL